MFLKAIWVKSPAALVLDESESAMTTIVYTQPRLYPARRARISPESPGRSEGA